MKLFSDESLIRLKSNHGDYLTVNEKGFLIFASKQLSNNNLWKLKKYDTYYTLQNMATTSYLHRSNSKDGVTTWVHLSNGVGNNWELEGELMNNETIQIKSWKSDYLHRGKENIISTSDGDVGNKWTVIIESKFQY